MFKSITIKNFRCFEELTIDKLERVNLIGGVNNIGKTAFLEAIFLLSGLNSIEIPFKLNFLRGMMKRQSIDVEDMCEWLFFKNKSNRVIEIETLDENNESSKITLKLDKTVDTKLFTFDSKINTRGRGIAKDLEIEYKKGEQNFKVKLFLTIDEDDDQVRIGVKSEEGELNLFPPSEFISSSITILPTDNAERFSNLEAINRQHEVIEILKILEPRLNRLAVLVNGGIPTIYGDIGLDSLIPIPLMGQGMGRLLSIVLAIFNHENGTVLIDEIENGLHHSITTKIWQAIAESARKTSNQIFATTHSIECIESAHKAFSESDEYSFSYYRLERKKDSDNIKVLTYNKNTINTSIDLNWEMR